MEQMLPSDPPDSDDGRNETSAWTGQKKHKLALDPCVSGDTNQDADACTSSFSDTQAKTAAQQVLEVTNKNIADAMRRTIFPGKEYLLKASSGEETSQRIDEQYIHFGPDIQFSNEDFDDYVRQLAPNSHHIDKFSRVSDGKFDEIMERHARYRIGFYKMFNKESGDKLKDPAEYSRGELLDENYFHRYEWDESLGWYFHPDHIGRAGLNDYQKLVLINHDSTEFLARDDYHSCFNTYEVDDDYVKYCGEISKKIKVEEAEAFDLITNAVYRTFHHTQTMWGYAAKKIDIAKKIGLGLDSRA
uniref:Uncharacterized protein n=1 Tax=Leersia perrieri TaxID=77586 RepID=A0A0D9VAL8_9ORYZ